MTGVDAAPAQTTAGAAPSHRVARKRTALTAGGHTASTRGLPPVAGCPRCGLLSRACPAHALVLVERENVRLRRQVKRLERLLARAQRAGEGA